MITKKTYNNPKQLLRLTRECTSWAEVTQLYIDILNAQDKGNVRYPNACLFCVFDNKLRAYEGMFSVCGTCPLDKDIPYGDGEDLSCGIFKSMYGSEGNIAAVDAPRLIRWLKELKCQFDHYEM